MRRERPSGYPAFLARAGPLWTKSRGNRDRTNRDPVSDRGSVQTHELHGDNAHYSDGIFSSDIHSVGGYLHLSCATTPEKRQLPAFHEPECEFGFGRRIGHVRREMCVHHCDVICGDFGVHPLCVAPPFVGHIVLLFTEFGLQNESFRSPDVLRLCMVLLYEQYN